MHLVDHAASGRKEPAGWYFLIPAADLPPGAVRDARLAGRDLAVWRTASGAVRAAPNACPHLRGRLAPNGRVDGEELVCALHSLRFGEGGRCTGGPIAGAAGRLALDELPVIEAAGGVFAWYGPAGSAAGWTPAFPEAGPGWSPFTFQSFDLQTRPEVVMQDLADPSHFETIHRYADLDEKHPLSFEGPSFSVGYEFTWDAGTALASRLFPRMRFDSRVDGLGYQLTEVASLGGRMLSRHLVLPTPLDAHTTRVTMGLSTHVSGLPVPPGFRWLTQAAVEAFTWRIFHRDIGRDAAYWVDRYLPAPQQPLDERIRAYQGWVDQFRPPVREAPAGGAPAVSPFAPALSMSPTP